MAKAKQSIIEEVDLDAPLKLYKTIDKKRTDRSWLISKFDIWMSLNNKSINTITTYLRIIDGLIPKDRFEYPRISSREITTYLQGKSGLNISAIRTFLKFVYHEFGRKFNSLELPTVKNIRDKNDVEVLSEKEIYKLIDCLPENRKLFTETLYLCALRINEAYRINVGDFNWGEWDEDTSKYGILILHKTKSGRKRSILISSVFMTKIYKYLISRDKTLKLKEPLFRFKRSKKYFKKKMALAEELGVGNILNLSDADLLEYRRENILHNFIRMKSNSFEKLFRGRCKEFLSKASHPHVLRASRLTNLLNSGMPIIQVRNFAGHESIVSTEFYLNSNLNDLRKTMEGFNL